MVPPSRYRRRWKVRWSPRGMSYSCANHLQRCRWLVYLLSLALINPATWPFQIRIFGLPNQRVPITADQRSHFYSHSHPPSSCLALPSTRVFKGSKSDLARLFNTKVTGWWLTNWITALLIGYPPGDSVAPLALPVANQSFTSLMIWVESKHENQSLRLFAFPLRNLLLLFLLLKHSVRLPSIDRENRKLPHFESLCVCLSVLPCQGFNSLTHSHFRLLLKLSLKS